MGICLQGPVSMESALVGEREPGASHERTDSEERSNWLQALMLSMLDLFSCRDLCKLVGWWMWVDRSQEHTQVGDSLMDGPYSVCQTARVANVALSAKLS